MTFPSNNATAMRLGDPRPVSHANTIELQKQRGEW